MTRISPRVATISERKWAAVARWWVEIDTAALENIRLATTAPADAAGHLGGQIRAGVAPAQPAEGGVDEGDHRVEMRPRDRAEHQDDGVEPGGGGRRVLEQLEPDVARRELLGGDARADDDGGQEGAAEQLGDQAAPQRRFVHCHHGRRRIRTTGAQQQALEADGQPCADRSPAAPRPARSPRSSIPDPVSSGASARTV